MDPINRQINIPSTSGVRTADVNVAASLALLKARFILRGMLLFVKSTTLLLICKDNLLATVCGRILNVLQIWADKSTSVAMKSDIIIRI